jgi:Fe-S cluster biogenesis protein NfuA
VITPEPRVVAKEIERLLDQLYASGDRRVWEPAEELVRLVTELHGAGLARVVELADSPELVGRLLEDDLVSSLLLLHGLHPDDTRTRVEQGLEKVRPYVHSHGGEVELIDIDENDVVHLRMLGSCDGCPSSAITLKTSVEQAVLDAAPEVAGIEVENLEPPPAATPVVGTPVTLGARR